MTVFVLPVCSTSEDFVMTETSPQTDPFTSNILTVHEVTEYLRLAESTVYRLAQEGEIPDRKIGGTWRFSKNGLDRWLRERPMVTHSRKRDVL